MRKTFLVTVGLAVMAGAGLAAAQEGERPGRQFGIFQADANDDGAVTRAEFDASRNARFSALDADGDGYLTREEMRAGWGERAERAHHGRRGRHGMRHLAGADANNDGSITRDEFLARPLQMFERLDTNGDGVIGPDERPQRRQDQRSERHRIDSDNDGRISQAEFTAMGAARFERLDANGDGRVTREEADPARGRRGHR